MGELGGGETGAESEVEDGESGGEEDEEDKEGDKGVEETPAARSAATGGAARVGFEERGVLRWWDAVNLVFGELDDVGGWIDLWGEEGFG